MVSRNHEFDRPKWPKRKHKAADASPWNSDSDKDVWDEDFAAPMEMRGEQNCILTNEFRILVGTWNVAGRSPVEDLVMDLDDWLKLKDPADIFVLGFQEIVPLTTANVLGTEDNTTSIKWNSLIGKALNKRSSCPWMTPPLRNFSNAEEFQICEGRSNNSKTMAASEDQLHHGHELSGHNIYWPIAGKKMVGVFITIWAKKDLILKHCISNVKICTVGCGIMGYLGNKGSISVSLHVEGTSFCFISAHLASGERRRDEAQRNYQVSEIFRRTTFPRHSQDHDLPCPQTILGHDQIFWLGDLNYRLSLEDSLARQLIKKEDWKALQEFDELKKAKAERGVFQDWKEGSIEFAPTYKYSSSNCNRYSGGVPSRTGEKQRTPAWCDRILWLGKEVKQLSYVRSESKFSDHRPVSALFSTQVEVVRCTQSKNPKPPNFTNQQTSMDDGSDIRCQTTTLLSLMINDTDDPLEQDAITSLATIT